MSTDKYDLGQPIKTDTVGSRAMWCETCASPSLSKKTVVRTYKNGTQIQIDVCGECKSVQETEFYTGPTTRIQNKDDK